MPKKALKNEPLTTEQIALAGINYVSLKDKEKELKEAQKKIRVPLEDFLNKNGRETASGSLVSEVSYADKVVTMTNTLRVSKILLPEAMDILKTSGLEDCIEYAPVIREDVLEVKVQNGEISADILRSIYQLKESYAFSVSLKDKFNEDESDLGV